MISFKTFIYEAKSPYNPLKITDFRKDENRGLAFIKKVKDGSPFQGVQYTDIVIAQSEIDAITNFFTADENTFPLQRTKLEVITDKGPLTIPGSFLKTPEFGGKGQGSGTKAEDAAMTDFNNKLNAILVKEGLGQVMIMINNRVVDVAQMVSTKGTYKGRAPKSDMTLINALGEPQAYISHKAGKSAKDYQQYGGVSDKKYNNNLDLKSFMDAVHAETGGTLSKKQSFYRPVKDDSLIFEAIYGPAYPGPPSISNIDEFHLGNMDLKGSGEGPYRITSTHSGRNGDKLKGSFSAVYVARYQGRRSPAKAAGVTIKEARVGIFPLAKIASTTKKI